MATSTRSSSSKQTAGRKEQDMKSGRGSKGSTGSNSSSRSTSSRNSSRR